MQWLWDAICPPPFKKRKQSRATKIINCTKHAGTAKRDNKVLIYHEAIHTLLVVQVHLSSLFYKSTLHWQQMQTKGQAFTYIALQCNCNLGKVFDSKSTPIITIDLRAWIKDRVRPPLTTNGFCCCSLVGCTFFFTFIHVYNCTTSSRFLRLSLTLPARD